MQPYRQRWVEEWCESAAHQQQLRASSQDPAAEDCSNAAGKGPPPRDSPGFRHPMSERGVTPSQQRDEATCQPAPKPAPDSLLAPETGSDSLAEEEWQHLDSLSEVMRRKAAAGPFGRRGRRRGGYRRPCRLRSEAGAAAQPPVSLMAECPSDAGELGFQQARRLEMAMLRSGDLELPWRAGSSQHDDRCFRSRPCGAIRP